MIRKNGKKKDELFWYYFIEARKKYSTKELMERYKVTRQTIYNWTYQAKEKKREYDYIKRTGHTYNHT